MKKKKRTVLPRVTVYAMSKRDLVAFVQAVEQLQLVAADLHAAANRITAGKKKPAPRPAAPPPAEGGES